MKTKLTLLLAALASASLTLISCSSTPTAFESGVFDIRTNYIPVTVLQTNTVYFTNQIPVFQTNQLNQIVVSTNTIVIPQYTLTSITQMVPAYEYLRGTNSQNITDTATAIGNIVSPGVGGPIAGAIASLALAAWGWIRSSKATATAQNSGQVIEVARELLKTFPQGEIADTVLTQWMQQHQAEAGVLPQVLTILENSVDNTQAKAIAEQLKSAIGGLQAKA